MGILRIRDAHSNRCEMPRQSCGIRRSSRPPPAHKTVSGFMPRGGIANVMAAPKKKPGTCPGSLASAAGRHFGAGIPGNIGMTVAGRGSITGAAGRP